MKFLYNAFYILSFVFKKSGQVSYYAQLAISTTGYTKHDIYLL